MDDYRITQVKQPSIKVEREIMNRVIGERLTKTRIALGLKPADVVDAFPKMHKSHLSEWESGKKPITIYWLRELARHYGVSLDYLVGDSQDCEELRSMFEFKRILSASCQAYTNELAHLMQTLVDNQAYTLHCYEQLAISSQNVMTAFTRLLELNSEAWQDIKAGARLEVAINQLKIAILAVENAKQKRHGTRLLNAHEAYAVKQQLQPTLPLTDFFTEDNKT